MEKSKKSLVLGIFIFISLALIIAVSSFLSSYGRLRHEKTYVLRFTGDLNGIHVGTDVEFRGIKIGEVTKIRIFVDPDTGLLTMPIWVQFLKRLVIKNQDEPKFTRMRLKNLIKRGLRAQLKTSNMLTGDQVITLVFAPSSPVKIHYPDALEIPTIPAKSNTEMLRQTLKTARKTLASITKTMDTTNKTVANINKQVHPMSVQVNNLIATLEKAVYNISVLAEYLSRHPEAIIKGKYKGS